MKKSKALTTQIHNSPERVNPAGDPGWLNFYKGTYEA